MRILFSKPKYVGDALLLTPTVTAVREAYPDAEIWVLVRKGSEDILRGCVAVDRVVTVAAAPPGEKRKRTGILDDLALVARLRRQKFDILFELGDVHRARWIALACGAKRVFSTLPRSPLGWFWHRWFDGISGFDWRGRHRVEKDFRSVHEFLPLPGAPGPLVYARAASDPWPPAAALGNFAIIHPGTRDQGKRWPRESWAEVGRFLLARFDTIVVSVGPLPQEREDGRWLAEALGPHAISTGGETSLPQLAGLLYEAALFVGVDTAAMHLAAACQTPTVALFGPSRESEWHPWCVPYRLVVPEQGLPAEELPAAGGTLRAMADIPVQAVISACEELLAQRAVHR